MTRLVLLVMIASLLSACSTHRAVRVRCTDRLEPINRASDAAAASDALGKEGDPKGKTAEEEKETSR